MAAKKQINVRIAEPLLETVAEAARRRGETVTGVVEKAFEAYVQDAQPQSPPEPADPPAAPEKPAPRARAPRRATAKTPPEPIAAQDEGERITAEIESDPDEVARLRRSRQQARDGETVHWDPGPLAEDWGPAPVPKKDCKHPNMRVKKGFCPDCQTWVSGGR